MGGGGAGGAGGGGCEVMSVKSMLSIGLFSAK
jgi:hypothetical protein